ncbi:hypothetical protein GCM10010420_39180 [Streptomyces glaucosporus]|uniref:Uncharacterized protein n=1 Tax=Streptomyces glaucosporus TaxID=284044 RepID=A0ABN3IKJ8_9ACTN
MSPNGEDAVSVWTRQSGESQERVAAQARLPAGPALLPSSRSAPASADGVNPCPPWASPGKNS